MEKILESNRNLLLVFNRFDIISSEYKEGISQTIDMLFETTDGELPIKINMLFLVKGDYGL